MKTHLLILLMVASGCAAYKPEGTVTRYQVAWDNQYEDLHVTADEMPEIVGGQTALAEALEQVSAEERCLYRGRVIVQLIVDEQGDVVEAQLSQGIGAGCDEVALEAVKQLAFRPGRVEGTPVKVALSMQVPFH